MKSVDDYNYDIYETPRREIIAVSSFAGKSVRGVAKCSDSDVYDFDSGCDLAVARCALKIADKRLRRAEKKYAEAITLMHEAEKYCERMENYFDDAAEAAANAQEHLENLLGEM